MSSSSEQLPTQWGSSRLATRRRRIGAANAGKPLVPLLRELGFRLEGGDRRNPYGLGLDHPTSSLDRAIPSLVSTVVTLDE